jgi:hypothetical protein
MMAETISQANHCFSISERHKTQNSTKPSDNKKFIILPEMANAVICPETGKSLRHQELITQTKLTGYTTLTQFDSYAGQISKRTKSDIWLICSGHQGLQGGKRAHQINHWRRSNWISRGQISSNRRFDHGKNLINSVISTLGAKFLVIDINIFSLNTPLGRFEYMVINLSSIPQENIDKYYLIELSQDRKVYKEIQKGMYGLPHAGILTNELLQRNLAKAGYRPTQHTHGLWTHDTHPISFLLVVDDFGVK